MQKIRLKAVLWDEKAKKYVRSLELETRKEIGTLLMILQTGLRLGEPQSKPFRTLHANGFELRLKDKRGAHRIFYVLIEDDKILVPHAFLKKSQKTPKNEILTAKARLVQLIKGNA